MFRLIVPLDDGYSYDLLIGEEIGSAIKVGDKKPAIFCYKIIFLRQIHQRTSGKISNESRKEKHEIFTFRRFAFRKNTE